MSSDAREKVGNEFNAEGAANVYLETDFSSLCAGVDDCLFLGLFERFEQHQCTVPHKHYADRGKPAELQ